MKQNRPSIDEVKRLISYDPDKGALTWKVRPLSNFKNLCSCNSWNARYAGNEIGGVLVYGRRKYRRAKFLGKNHLAHRVAWAIFHGYWPKGEIDHVDHNGLNNRISNLRDVEKLENLRNAKLSSANTSGHVGVRWHRRDQKWEARIGVDGNVLHLGLFEKFNDAVKARKSAEKKFGFHPNHGAENVRQQPECQS